LDDVEVLEIDQWLALLITEDLDPYAQPVTPRTSLPTGSAKSQFGLGVVRLPGVQLASRSP